MVRFRRNELDDFSAERRLPAEGDPLLVQSSCHRFCADGMHRSAGDGGTGRGTYRRLRHTRSGGIPRLREYCYCRLERVAVAHRICISGTVLLVDLLLRARRGRATLVLDHSGILVRGPAVVSSILRFSCLSALLQLL